jgi:hypothetical protein
VSLFASRGSTSNQIRLYGRISSSAAACKSNQRVKIKMKTSRRYRVVGRVTSDARGKYSFEKGSPGVRSKSIRAG